MSNWNWITITAAIFIVTAGAGAEDAAPLSALAKVPVREITVFKDGHAFVVHEGNMPVDSAGDVRMDYLPTPVLGTFWPYSVENAARLASVTASPQRVLVDHTALTVKELLEANPGAQISLYDPIERKSYTAQILDVPARSSHEEEAVSPADAGEKLPVKSNLVLLKRAEGVQVVSMDRIQDMVFTGVYRKTLQSEEFRNLLTLKMDWKGARPPKTAHVGMMYVQKGIRWIPGYKIAVDGKGSATIHLQATLINEMTDLSDVTANLVIGVPTFAFQDTVDPISLQQTAARLSPYFQSGSQTSYALSNGLMGQLGGQAGGFAGGQGPPGPGGGAPAPEIGGSDRNEDLFVFTVNHLSLKKGQRTVISVAEMTVKYQDVYLLDLPFAPPREIQAQIRSEQQNEALRLSLRPKVMHSIRISNRTKFPLTTAPALILSGDRVLAQAMMTYTPVGGDVDLPLTTAVDVTVKKTDRETARIPRAEHWDGSDYERIDLTGVVSLTNYRAEAVNVEATRSVLGNVGTADHGGVAQMVNVFEDDTYEPASNAPIWWGSYSWPGWWSHFNGVGRIKWKVKVEAGKSVDLGYTWHYFWR